MAVAAIQRSPSWILLLDGCAIYRKLCRSSAHTRIISSSGRTTATSARRRSAGGDALSPTGAQRSNTLLHDRLEREQHGCGADQRGRPSCLGHCLLEGIPVILRHVLDHEAIPGRYRLSAPKGPLGRKTLTRGSADCSAIVTAHSVDRSSRRVGGLAFPLTDRGPLPLLTSRSACGPRRPALSAEQLVADGQSAAEPFARHPGKSAEHVVRIGC